MSEQTLREKIEAMVEYRPGSEFHRGWSGAVSAILAMIDAMQAEPNAPKDAHRPDGDHQDSA